MPDRQIRIVRKPDNTAQPEDGFRTQLQKGATVMFTVPPGATGVSIEFKGRSPFDSNVLQYGHSVAITAVHDDGDPKANVYPYECTLIIDGQTIHSKPSGAVGIVGGIAGGEIEVIPGSNQ